MATEEIAPLTFVETSDDGESEHVIECLCTPAQVRAYVERRFMPTFWAGHPSEISGFDSQGRPTLAYDCRDQRIPSDHENGGSDA